METDTIEERRLFRSAEVLATELVKLKPSAILLLACEDLKKVAATPNIVLSPGHWFQRRIGVGGQPQCLVCLAGGMLKVRLNPGVVTINACDMPHDMARTMHMLNCFRTGHCYQGVHAWVRHEGKPELPYTLNELEKTYCQIMPDMSDPKFLEYQKAMAADMRRIGL